LTAVNSLPIMNKQRAVAGKSFRGRRNTKLGIVMYIFRKLLPSLLGLLLVAMAAMTIGCSSMEPYTVENEAEGMMPGSGLLTGETGEKTIFSLPAKSDGQTEKVKAADES